MEWLNLHTSTLDSPQFVGADPAERATWLCLLRYCVGQENGGRIGLCREWNDRRWQQLCRVTKREVIGPSDLWQWDGDDLVVWAYPLKKEEEVKRNRSNGAKGGRPDGSGKTTHQATHQATQQGNPTDNPEETTRLTSRLDSGSISAETERKGREGKGKEYTPLPPGGVEQAGDATPAPKRSRKAKPGYVLPTELPEPLASRLIALGALKGRLASTPWAPGEVEAVRAARLDVVADEDFAAQLTPLRYYYSAAIPEERDYRRRDLGTLLNNWSSELDRARVWARGADDGVQRHG